MTPEALARSDAAFLRELADRLPDDAPNLRRVAHRIDPLELNLPAPWLEGSGGARTPAP